MIVKMINSHNEVSLLIVTSAAFNQFLNIEQSQYLNRISLYTAILLIGYLITMNYIIFINLSNQAVLKKGGITQENPFLILVEKLDFKKRPRITRVYYFF